MRLSEYQTLRVVASSPEALELESRWSPGASPPRTHWHPTQHEYFEVLEGALTVELADEPARMLGPGDKLMVPPRTAHRMWNASSDVTRASWRVTPAQRTEDMFLAVAHGLNPITAVVTLMTYRNEMRLGRPKP